MKRKYVLLIILVLLAGIAGIKTFSRAKSQQEPEQFSLAWRAQRVAASGGDFLPIIVHPQYTSVGSLDEALTKYSVVVGRPIAERTYQVGDQIVTWYKFQTDELLSSRAMCVTCGVPSPPQDMLPLNPGEFLVPRYTGSIMISGVEISTSEGQFPDFQMGQKYMLFLNRDESTKVGKVIIGPIGAFTVDAYGNLTPLLAGNHLASGLASQYGNSLTQLRAALGGSTPSPSPTPTLNTCTASPTMIRKCSDMGGYWDDEMCKCT